MNCSEGIWVMDAFEVKLFDVGCPVARVVKQRLERVLTSARTSDVPWARLKVKLQATERRADDMK